MLLGGKRKRKKDVAIARYAALQSWVSGGERSSAALFVASLKLSQTALRKFQRFTGLPDTSCTRDGAVISDGLWWERGNLSRMRLSGSGSSWFQVVNAKSRLFQRDENNLVGGGL